MSILIDEQTAALNEVREKCVKAAGLYADAGDHVGSSALAATLEGIGRERRRLADALAFAMAEATETLPKATDPEQIGVDRLVRNATASLAGGGDGRYVANCLDADGEVLAALDADALANPDALPGRLPGLLSELRAACLRARDHLD